MDGTQVPGAWPLPRLAINGQDWQRPYEVGSHSWGQRSLGGGLAGKYKCALWKQEAVGDSPPPPAGARAGGLHLQCLPSLSCGQGTGPRTANTLILRTSPSSTPTSTQRSGRCHPVAFPRASPKSAGLSPGTHQNLVREPGAHIPRHRAWLGFRWRPGGGSSTGLPATQGDLGSSKLQLQPGPGPAAAGIWGGTRGWDRRAPSLARSLPLLNKSI